MQYPLDIELRYLAGRQCLEIPEIYEKEIHSYLQLVYDLLKHTISGETIKYIIVCYSRKFTPRCKEKTCVISDLQYVSFLSDLSLWVRTQDDELLETIYSKYMKNHYLSNNDYDGATFFEWVLKHKYRPFSPRGVDLARAYKMNLIALLHESSHFIEGFNEFEKLFAENSVDKAVTNPQRTMTEGKCDYLGLTTLLMANVSKPLSITDEELVHLYYEVLMANCFYTTCANHSEHLSTSRNVFDDTLDRVKSTMAFMHGMRQLFPNLDMEKIRDLSTLQLYAKGLEHIGHALQTKFVEYANEYNNLPITERSDIRTDLQKEEKNKRSKKRIYVYPEIQAE